MIRSKDIVGLPIYTLAEGKDIGKITEILVNPSRGLVVALAIENTSKIVSFASIKSIGKDAVVIDSASQFMELSENRNIERWKDIKIMDSKVITSSGQFMGQVSDFLIDILTGKIISCLATDPEGEKLVISASRIVTFGKDALIIVEPGIEEVLETEEKEEAVQMDEALEAVKEEKKAEREEIKTVLEQLAEEIEKEPKLADQPTASETLEIAEQVQAPSEEQPAETPLSQPEQVETAPPPPMQPEESKPEPEIKVAEPQQTEEPEKQAPPVEPEEAKITPIKKEEPETAIPEEVPPSSTQVQPTIEPAGAAAKEVTTQPPGQEIKGPEEQVQELLNRRQHDFLLGKTIKKDLLADNGAVILKSGETITEEILNKAKKANKYLELGFYV